ncbi:hypothetical protein MHY1_01020 [Methylovirgula sp. HY1]|nr:hypothetical protein MHY1_01020 [Methylovirgula sp. HY1]
MTTFSALILICSLSVSASDCGPKNAVDVIKVPVTNELQCGLMAQSALAGNGAAFAPRPGKEFVKIMCKRNKTKGTH